MAGLAGSRALLLLPPALALAAATVLGVARAASAGPGGAPAVAAQAPPSSPPGPDVERIFLSDCAVCHGSDARGTARGPSLVGVGRAFSDYELSTGRMPLVGAGRPNDQSGRALQPLPNQTQQDPDLVARRHAPAYPPQTIQALVDYVAVLTGGGGPDVPIVRPGDVAMGGDLFRLQCAACHAWAGDGGALLRREAPALHSATPTQVAEAVRVGPGQMPAFGTAALTDEQVDSVVAYVRYLDHPDDRGGQPLWHMGPFTEGAVALLSLVALLLFTRWIGERG
ncbi:MAG: cytochrome c [Acidimicrobiales bacterium]